MKKIEKNRYVATTPVLDEKTMQEISGYEVIKLGGGVLCFRGAVDIDQDTVLPWIDRNAQKAHEGRWRWFTDEDGNKYALNEDDNKFTSEQIDEVPVRVLQPVVNDTEEHMEVVFRGWEDSMYKCLIRYTQEYAMVLGTIWWRQRGHILRYDKGDLLGVHNDNDSNYRSTGGERFIPQGQIQMRQTVAAMLYLNDCMESPELVTDRTYSGGQLFFPYLDIEHQAKTGDILIFPTNFVATHGVRPVTAGERYGYLEFFSQGSPDPEHYVEVYEPDKVPSWCPAHWLDNYFDDFAKYSHWSAKNMPVTMGDIRDNLNPVLQNRSLEGENGLAKSYKHARPGY